MTISYKWLSEYLPQTIEPEKLSGILTSIGLEVESMTLYESIPGGLKGLMIGKVLECVPHPNADKLKLTKVDVGGPQVLNIVCGAKNVAEGQNVLVAPAGTTIYPSEGEPLTMKIAKIRGEESQGMICAEDEVGIGKSHEGIMVLPGHIEPGTKAADYFKPYTDWVYEIGLTPNRMDAMSHYGVAKDVCAYLTHHKNTTIRPVSPYKNIFKPDDLSLSLNVEIENTDACRRYAGVTISHIKVGESPVWLKDKLLAIGQRPINNIVDITNYILHETGQPLHAFDADKIKGKSIIVKNLPSGTPFISLDEKERKLDKDDLMICNGAEEGMCMAGVFGGSNSGVQPETKNIFIESAWFNPVNIRKSSLRHNLRTDAAARFEKGVDIANVVNALKRAATLVKEIAGGKISSEIVDVYPNPSDKTSITLKYHYLKKLSGKNYHPDAVKRILTSLDFDILKDSLDELRVAVPYSKPDITLPADLVEEIVRIDGLDNIDIPTTMTVTPAADESIIKENVKEKIAGFLVGRGFYEMVTNAITNSRYYSQEDLKASVKMINSLSTELDVMRPSMVESGLEAIAYNINRKNKDLRLFEFGKVYKTAGVGQYSEKETLTLFITGLLQQGSWQTKPVQADFFMAKGLLKAVLQLSGITSVDFHKSSHPDFTSFLSAGVNKKQIATVGEVAPGRLKIFDIKQPVFVIEIDEQYLVNQGRSNTITYKEVSRFPAVNRDLALVVNKSIQFDAVENAISSVKNSKLQQVQLFDIFESEKLGPDKKSMAISFTFIDEEKTLTDKETESMINKLIATFEKELGAEIRK